MTLMPLKSVWQKLLLPPSVTYQYSNGSQQGRSVFGSSWPAGSPGADLCPELLVRAIRGLRPSPFWQQRFRDFLMCHSRHCVAHSCCYLGGNVLWKLPAPTQEGAPSWSCEFSHQPILCHMPLLYVPMTRSITSN